MASPKSSNCGLEFVEPPDKLKEFQCVACEQIPQEPNLTSCCGQHLCESCTNRALTGRKPCPYCQQDFTAMLDKKQKRKVSELKVKCTMKERGCAWTGEFGQLESHLDTQKGVCQFVDLSCPYSCGKSYQRRHLVSHLSDTCPKRPFTCMYCGLKSTYNEICNKHHTRCVKFPLPCPNKCEAATIERGKMKEHLSNCPLQVVECEYASAGCTEVAQRKDLENHLKGNVQKHLSLVFKANQEKVQELEKRVHAQIEKVKKDTDLKLMGKDNQIAVSRTQVRELEERIRDKEEENALLLRRVATLERLTILPPITFILQRYSLRKKAAVEIEGAVFYTHRAGVKVKVNVSFDSLMKRLAVKLHTVPGEFDDDTKWPVNCEMTMHLLSTDGDRDRISGYHNLSFGQPTQTCTEEFLLLQVDYNTIEHQSRRRVQYLKDDTIKFRIDVKLA